MKQVMIFIGKKEIKLENWIKYLKKKKKHLKN